MEYYNRSFSDYDHNPAFFNTAGWYEFTSNNDVCPSFAKTEKVDGHELIVFTEYKKESMREATGGLYFVILQNDDGDNITLLDTDSIDKVNSLIESLTYG